MSETEIPTPQQTDNGPGKQLHDARVQVRLSREQVAEMLHLSPQQIRALESNDFKSLPGSTYVRGYLRSYAQLLGLPVDEIVGSYARLNGTFRSARLNALVPEPQVTTRDGSVKFATFLVVTVLIVLAVVWWQGRDYRLLSDGPVGGVSIANGANDGASPGPARTSDLGTLPVASGPELGPAPTASALPAVPPPATGTAGDMNGRNLPASEPDAASGSTTTSGAAFIEPGRGPGSTQAWAGREANPAETVDESTGSGVASPPVAANQARLVLTTREEVWVDVRDARDNRLVYKLLPEGRKMTVFGTPPLKVFLGNPGGITVEYNGKNIDTRQFQRGRVARFTLGATTSDN
jgi:cytoskeleton protein RodZ